jgi:hypothetical protein
MEITDLARQAALVRSACEGAPPQMIAESAEAIWVDVAAALTPIIGSRGVGALYARSVSLLREEHGWLKSAYDGANGVGPFTALGAALEARAAAEAVAANGALLQTFYDLLASLIGGPLTARLLTPALDHPATGDAGEDRES